MTTPKASLLLVDDDTSLLRLLNIRLTKEGYQVVSAENAEQAMAVVKNQQIDLVLSDLRMPGMDGRSLFQALQRSGKRLPLILMTAHGTIEDAIAATKEGVMGFITKPIDHSQLREALNNALAHSPANNADWQQEIITRSPHMLQLLEQAHMVAKRDVSLLITGPSGAGKELLAKAIHNGSLRQQQAFIPINCGALPEALLESELFGHTKGAFTGATQDHRGLFQQADGGTLFLDEIGDMPLPLQVKLLRALQEQRIRPVGSSVEQPIDVRIISATHRDLHKEMQLGHFREDLFYRLNVVNLDLPSLKQRAEDIPLLARYLLEQSARRHQLEVNAFTDDAMQLLITSDWPGNVRQLVNVVERCVALTQTPVIPAHLVQQALSASDNYWPSLSEARQTFEQDYLIKLLKMTEGNVTRAAEMADRNRTDMHKLLKKHQLNAEDFR